jgi:Fe-S-cluster containining protein
MSNLLNICLACGICCDGTLIGFVELNREEIPRLKEIMEIEAEDDKGFFLQPCKKYCDGCTIYSKRPKQCGAFECGLLKSFEQNELDYETAIDIISLVKQKKSAIEKRLELLDIELKSESFHFKMAELKNLLQKKTNNKSLTQSHLELIYEVERLDSLLSEKFNVTLY